MIRQEVDVYSHSRLQRTISMLDERGHPISYTVAEEAQQDLLFLHQWLHGRPTTTQRVYVYDINQFYRFTRKALREVTLADIQAFHDYLVVQAYGQRSIARKLSTIKSVCTFGSKTRYLPFNVGAAALVPRLEDTLSERILLESQVARLLALETNPRNHLIIVLLYRAGLRASELCDLEWRHVQPHGEAGQLTVFGKGRKTRHVLLDAETWRELIVSRQDAPDDSPVFHSFGPRRGKLDGTAVWRMVKQAAARAGLSAKVSAHWMRHAHASHAQENGAPIGLVQATLGHGSITTTAHYTHVRPGKGSSTYLKV